MKVIDLSHTITADMPVFPGTDQPEIAPIVTHEEHGYLEHKLTIFSHVGTHIDAPAHMIKDAQTLDQMDATAFCGTALALDLTTKNENNRTICIDDLAPFEAEIAENDFLILNTGWYKHWGSTKYFSDYPALTAEGATWLADFDLKGIGVDVISIDPPENKDFAVHNILLSTGMIIIENLTNLHRLPECTFVLSCLPLKYEGADGSPVRAAAFV